MIDFINSLIPYINSFGPLVYAVFFLVAAIESIVFLGMLLPGTLIIIFMGFVSSGGSLNVIYLIGVTTLGACLGDYVSFYLGLKKGHWVMKHVARFTKVDYIKTGEIFFREHGEKSVFIGRFVAFVRPFVPFVAGLFRMDRRKFFLWNTLGAVAWSALYILIGYFFGYTWRTAAGWASKIALLLFVVFGFAVISYFMKKKVVAPIVVPAEPKKEKNP